MACGAGGGQARYWRLQNISESFDSPQSPLSPQKSNAGRKGSKQATVQEVGHGGPLALGVLRIAS